jgi:hypothetical protein
MSGEFDRALETLQEGIRQLQEAALMRVCEPHPAEQQLAELQETLGQLMGRCWGLAGYLTQGGDPHTAAVRLRTYVTDARGHERKGVTA